MTTDSLPDAPRPREPTHAAAPRPGMRISTGIGIAAAAFTGLAILGAAMEKRPPGASAIASPASVPLPSANTAGAAVHPEMAPPGWFAALPAAPPPASAPLAQPPAPPSAWTATTLTATFGTGERAITARMQATISRTGQRQQRDGTITVTRSQAWVVTGDPFICRSIPGNDVQARWAIGTGQPRADRWQVSADHRAMFVSAAFRRGLLDAKAPVLVEVVDACGRVTVFSVPVDGVAASAQAAGFASGGRPVAGARVGAPVPVAGGR